MAGADVLQRMFAIPTDRLIAAFESCTLAKAEWTHQAHLRVGLWHIDRYGADEALIRLRHGIRRLNESHGTVNSETAGYHETITRFFVLLMAQFLAAAERSTSLDELTARFIARYPTSDLPLRYYTRERLFSVAARREWVEPDVRAIDHQRPELSSLSAHSARPGDKSGA